MLGEMFWVMYGDSFMDIDYAKFLARFTARRNARPPLGLMTVIRNEDCWDRSNAIFNHGRLTCYDKHNRSADTHYIDYGVQLLRREAFANAPAGKFDLSDLYRDRWPAET